MFTINRHTVKAYMVSSLVFKVNVRKIGDSPNKVAKKNSAPLAVFFPAHKSKYMIQIYSKLIMEDIYFLKHRMEQFALRYSPKRCNPKRSIMSQQ